MRTRSHQGFCSSLVLAATASASLLVGCSTPGGDAQGSQEEAWHRQHDAGSATGSAATADAGTSTPAASTATCNGGTSLHYSAGGGIDATGAFPAGALGFDVADVSSPSELAALPPGVMGLVWLGMCNGADATFTSTVSSFQSVSSQVLGFYLMDEPDPTGQWNPACPIANLQAESDWIHANFPGAGARTFITMMNMGSSYSPSYSGTYNPSNSHIDLYGLDPYPCRTDLNGCDDSIIAPNVQAALDFGIPLSAIVPVYQAFGGGGWTDDTGGAYLVPTTAQENALFATWAGLVPSPVFDFAYAYGSQNNDTAIAQSSDLQQAFSAHNAGSCASGDAGAPPPPADAGSSPPPGDAGSTPPPPPSGSVAFVQAASADLGAPATSLTLTMANVNAGDLLIGWFLDDSSPGQIAVSDNVNGAWTRSVSQHYDGGSAGDVALYYKANSAPGNITVTVGTSAAAYIQATAAEYAGASATSPIDQVSTGYGNGTTASVGPTGALAAPGELVYAAVSVGTSVTSMAAGPGFTVRSATGSTGEEDMLASSTSGASASLSFGNATDWNMVVAAISPASGGGSCTPTTCAAQGKDCGTISDGCGGTLTCGACTSPQTCGGSGVANVCGGGVTSSAPHVMMIVMENHGYHDLIGSSSAPFINSLAQNYVSATAWYDVTHPSLPNYLALTAGSDFNSPSDCIPTWSNPTGDCTFDTSAPNLADQLTGATIPWKAYIEDLPSACDTKDNFGPNYYDVNHNPFMYYDNVIHSPAECSSDVPYSQLATDIANNTLPSFIWVSPNLIHDMHDGTIADGDTFLNGLVTQMQATAWYAQGGVILITWDEGETEEQIVLLAVSAKNAGKGAFTAQGNHYGVLRGIEEEYGLPLLGGAASAGNGDVKALLP